MATPPRAPLEDPKQAVRITRVIWAALLAGQIVFGVVAITLIGSSADAPTRGTSPDATSSGGGVASLFAIIALAILLGASFAGYFMRQQIFKAGWRGNAVSPQAYVTGTIALLAALEGAGIAAIALAIVEGRIFPTLTLAALAMAVQAMNFPTGSAMDETIPDLTTR